MQFLDVSDGCTDCIRGPVTAVDAITAQERVFGSDEPRMIYPFRASFPLSASQASILTSLSKHFTPDVVRDVLHHYTSQNASGVSLRSLDWLVTNYSKQRNIMCKSRDGDYVNIYNSYKLALSNYRRRNFDPFRRRLRIEYLHEGTWHPTTVGQVNFIWWAHSNGVLKFAEEHQIEIEQDMNRVSKLCRAGQRSTGRRNELSKAPSNRCFIYQLSARVKIS